MNLDGLDIVLHVVAALVIVSILIAFNVPWGWAVAANAIYWFVREGWQQYRKGKPLSPLEWSLQKWLEAVAPSIAGVLV